MIQSFIRPSGGLCLFWACTYVLLSQYVKGQQCSYFVGITTDETRLGDRMLDNWSLAAIFALKNPSTPCTILWQPNFAKDLNETIFVGQCTVRSLNTFVNARDYEFKLSDYDYLPNTDTTCVVDLQAWMGTPSMCSGCNDPVLVFSNQRVREFLPPGTEQQQLVDMYKKVATQTRLEPGSVTDMQMQQLRAELGRDGLVGIHVRTQDKLRRDQLNKEETRWFTRLDQSRDLIRRALHFARVHLVRAEGRRHLYIAVDEETMFPELVRALEEGDGMHNAVTVINKEQREKKTVLSDFFALTHCDVILQAAHYTSFSTAAAMVAPSTLVSFSSLSDNNLIRWLPVLNLNLIQKDFSTAPMEAEHPEE